MATDLVFTAELIDAVIAEITTRLPAGWVTPATNEVALKTLQPGDLYDWIVTDPNGLAGYLPAVIVRELTLTGDSTSSGTGGVDVTDNKFRLVHIRAFDQCVDDAGHLERNMMRARARYAKILGKALFGDPQRRLGSPVLTSADGAGAQVVLQQFESWDFGGASEEVQVLRRLRQRIWGIAVDFNVKVVCGGAA